MKLNTKQTEMIAMSKEVSIPQVKISIDGTEIEQVSKFTYLGHLITEDGKCDEEVKDV